MENIKIELELDQLQEIAISNVVASIREQGILLKAETNQEQKAKCKHFLKLQIENKCILNEDQKSNTKTY
jgi:prophage antirepressor-like protein